MEKEVFDAVVIGAGHAGCEAALALSRLGKKVCLTTINLDAIAFLACNPSIGGTAKGHLVCEIDALGGEMGKNADATAIQMRMLNKGKGPARRAGPARSAVSGADDPACHHRRYQGLLRVLCAGVLQDR